MGLPTRQGLRGAIQRLCLRADGLWHISRRWCNSDDHAEADVRRKRADDYRGWLERNNNGIGRRVWSSGSGDAQRGFSGGNRSICCMRRDVDDLKAIVFLKTV